MLNIYTAYIYIFLNIILTYYIYIYYHSILNYIVLSLNSLSKRREFYTKTEIFSQYMFVYAKYTEKKRYNLLEAKETLNT